MADGNSLKEKAQDTTQATFKVSDRRLFTAEGEPRREIPDEPEAAAKPAAPKPEPPPAGAPAEAGFERRSLEEPRGIDFTVLINAMM